MYRDKIDLIQDGQPVNASVTNKPLEQLQTNIQYLKQRIDSISSQSRIILQQVAVSPDVLVGQPVFFNSTTQQYEKAIADNTNKQYVIGLVYQKYGSSICDIITYGYMNLDLSNAITPVVAANYFLSDVEAGKLIANPNKRTVFVCTADGTGKVFVNPVFPEMREWHQNLISATGTTTDSYVTLTDLTYSQGLIVSGTIQNTGSTNSATIREEVISAFGNSAFRESTLGAGSNFIISLNSQINTAYPPFTNYKLRIKSTTTGSSTGYSLNLLVFPK
jgi:hypothetical protein